MLIELQTEAKEEEKQEILDGKHKEFFEYVIKDVMAEISLEATVSLEFMDRKERNSFTSDIANFAKAEEVEELMEDAYPVNTSEMQTTSLISSSQFEKLIDND